MSINLDNLSNDVEYNILLIGRSGDGKSAFVNAFSNYVKFVNLDEVTGGVMEEVIPNKYQISNDSTDEEIDSENDDYFENYQSFDHNRRTKSPSVYKFCCNDKVIRLIDTPGWQEDTVFEIDRKFVHTWSQCLSQFDKIHAIVCVTSEECFSLVEIATLQTISKRACNNVILCCIDDWIDRNESDISRLKSNIQENTKIVPKHGQNLLTIDNCVLECLMIHRQGHTFGDEQTTNLTNFLLHQCRTGFIHASGQIQTMLDYVASGEPCDVTNVVELMKYHQIKNLCMELIKHYYDNGNESKEIDQIVSLLKHNLTEYERIEDIYVQLCAMVSYSSVVEWDGFNRWVKFFKNIYINNEMIFNKIVTFCNKLSNITQNRQSYEAKFSKCSALSDFQQLFTELSNLQHSGWYFAQKITKIVQPPTQLDIKQITIKINRPKDQINETNLQSLIQLQQILSIVTENNLLLVSSTGTASCDLSNATLHNVVFTCGNSTNEMKDFIVNETHSNISETDIKFIVDNMDRLIKDNFDNLIPLIKNYSPVRSIVKNEQKKRKSTKTKPTETSPNQPTSSTSQSTNHIVSAQPSVVSSYRPFMQHLYQQSGNPDNLNNDIDLVIEQLLKIKVKRG